MTLTPFQTWMALIAVFWVLAMYALGSWVVVNWAAERLQAWWNRMVCKRHGVPMGVLMQWEKESSDNSD